MTTALLDVTDVLDDPDFQTTELWLTRQASVPRLDGRADGQGGSKQFNGVVIADGGHDLVQTPEGDQVAGDITIYTREPLTSGDRDIAADLIDWNGARYKVVNAKPWIYGPSYTQAVCKLSEINPLPTGTRERDDGGFLGSG